MTDETVDINEILEFPLPPLVGDKLTPGEWIADTVAIGVTIVFLVLWMVVCVAIWFIIGTPFLLILFVTAVFLNFLCRFFRKTEPPVSI